MLIFDSMQDINPNDTCIKNVESDDRNSSYHPETDLNHG